MDSDESVSRKHESDSESTGDRRTGSVGERPELAGSRDSGDRATHSGHKKHSIQEELDHTTGNDPGLGGE